MRAGQIYIVYLSALLCCQLLMLAADLFLWMQGEETVSAWLRANPRWYVYAVVVATVYYLGLLVHLFGLAPDRPGQ